jgi:hypothetical protein
MTPAKGEFTMATTEKQQPVEERVGSLIGKVFCLLLLAFMLWGYWTTVAAQLGLFPIDTTLYLAAGSGESFVMN